jgi:hypothetical protein
VESEAPTSDRRMRLMIAVDPRPDSDDQEVDELTAQLRRALLDLDVESVDRVKQGEVPPGVRGSDVLVLGTLVVTLANSARILATLVNTVQAWLSGGSQRSVKLQIDGDILEVAGLSSSDQRRLIANWIERHTGE